jgi:hypothetical protein
MPAEHFRERQVTEGKGREFVDSDGENLFGVKGGEEEKGTG